MTLPTESARAELERLQRAEAAAWNALNRARDAGNRYAIAAATHVARWAAAAAFDAERALFNAHAAAAYDAQHGARSDGFPPSDQDPASGAQYGEAV